ncbi:Similar to COP9 signalosome complex subunit 6; acc. no. Q5BB47 [Pyronema omphalodes CBS 100304]|uniref:COP9 signalosome complex subunit 6 n=1 Tax=Pyronema omphalodes (strain CBS 100304) TaxID=1076935 RepID=U4LN51_PYROM|nr:Similar to COP9 signalosome complex subunit 6; acc. no. Q5BB47 [Pyronema omphalodes CBS 100304]
MASLISQHASTSGLQIALHPLALLTISDYITRHALRNNTGPVIGALLGSQNGREIAIEYAYEILLAPSTPEKPVVIDKTWFEKKLSLFKDTHPSADLLGWFTTTFLPTYEPTPDHASIHQELLSYNESLCLLMMNPSPSGSINGKLPIAIYESIHESADKLSFIPLNYTIETGEAEMIAMDFVAQGAGGAASLPMSAPAGDAGGKGKQVEKVVKEGEEMVQGSSQGQVLNAQSEELISQLTAKKNAITMLNSRIKLLLEYLKNPPQGIHNHQVLREIKALTHSRLQLLKPTDMKAFEQEKRAEESDSNLVVLLGAVTRCMEDVRVVQKKCAGIEAVFKNNKAMEDQRNMMDRQGPMDLGVGLGRGERNRRNVMSGAFERERY